MIRKCQSESRSPIDENNDTVSKSWIVYRQGFATKLTYAAVYTKNTAANQTYTNEVVRFDEYLYQKRHFNLKILS